MVLEEAERIFGKGDGEACDIALILSIGSGISETNSPEPSMIKRLVLSSTAGLVRNSPPGETPKEQEMEKKFGDISGVYFRLNVVLGPPTEEGKDITQVQAHTNKYLNSAEVSSQLDEIVKILVNRTTEISILSGKTTGMEKEDMQVLGSSRLTGLEFCKESRNYVPHAKSHLQPTPRRLREAYLCLIRPCRLR
jgi:hypothetical protein